MKVGLLRHFLIHQWLEVFTTDLNIFEYVHASVNIPTFHSALARFCGRSLLFSSFPTTWFNLPHAWGELNRKNEVFRFQFLLRMQKAMSNNLCVNVLNGFNYQMPQF